MATYDKGPLPAPNRGCCCGYTVYIQKTIGATKLKQNQSQEMEYKERYSPIEKLISKDIK